MTLTDDHWEAKENERRLADTDEGVEGWEKLWPVPDAYLAEKLEEDAEWMSQNHPARLRMEVAARRLRNRESWEVLARLVESGREPSFYVGATGHGEKLACLGLVDPAEELTEPLDSDSPWTTLLRTALTQDREDESDG